MDKQIKENFEIWAHEQGFCLDCDFFDDGNSYLDSDTKLAFSIWVAAIESLGIRLVGKAILHKTDVSESLDGVLYAGAIISDSVENKDFIYTLKGL